MIVQIYEGREPEVTWRHSGKGGIDVLVEDWVYVNINYDYRYTDNASRLRLAKDIVELIKKSQ